MKTTMALLILCMAAAAAPRTPPDAQLDALVLLEVKLDRIRGRLGPLAKKARRLWDELDKLEESAIKGKKAKLPYDLPESDAGR